MDIVTLAIDNELKELLQLCELPTDDLDDAHPRFFFGARNNGQLVASVGIERYADAGLLRSLAVAPAYRRKSLGVMLLQHAERDAVANGIKTLYLLTSTVPAYFSNQGYHLVDRAQAPQAIRNTTQFAGLCPASADFMGKRLEATGQVF